MTVFLICDFIWQISVEIYPCTSSYSESDIFQWTIDNTKINGIISWLCYNTFGDSPEYIAATSARKICGIKVPKGQKAKDVALQFVLDNVPSFDIEYTRYGNPKAGYADRSDSYVIAKAGWIRESKEA